MGYPATGARDVHIPHAGPRHAYRSPESYTGITMTSNIIATKKALDICTLSATIDIDD
jgi:hypothetical protein